MVDSISIAIGAVLGTPPVTAFVESGAGIGEGGKTGLTAMSTGALQDASFLKCIPLPSMTPTDSGSF